MGPVHRFVAILGASLSLTGCGFNNDEDIARVVFIGSSADLVNKGVRLAPAGQHLRAATAEGLVTLNDNGEVVPGLAERWIVTEDGLSYIFRLRNTDWPDGTALSSEVVASALRRNLNELKGTSLGLDVSIIAEIRAMTGRVIEIRLKGQMPQFLQMMAQPELGLLRNGVGAGPMVASHDKDIAKGVIRLVVLPPDQRGEPQDENWQDRFRAVDVASLPAKDATAAFENGQADAVFNGRLASLPLANTGPLARGTVRLDAVYGLFGLQVTNADGVLADPARREAIAMAIDRTTLLQPFNIGGWVPSTRIIPPDLPDASYVAQERWAQMTLEQRQQSARSRLAASGAGPLRLSILLPEGPGSVTLFEGLAADLAAVGVTLRRAEAGQKADLVLVDWLARYADDRWFLNQFNCGLKRGLCSPEADEFVTRAINESDRAQRAAWLRSAEQALLEANIYIPIGAPIRWSLIRGDVDGFSENRSGLHPLFPMAKRPT